MDMAIAIIDKEKKVLRFAGANNPLYLIRKSSQLTGKEVGPETALPGKECSLFEYKGDKQPIGWYWEETKFTSHRIQLMDGDTFYIFTDGFVDQFGGPHRKKYKSHRFKELLLSMQHESMERQKHLLEDAFEAWRKDQAQTDDLCIIGIRM